MSSGSGSGSGSGSRSAGDDFYDYLEEIMDSDAFESTTNSVHEFGYVSSILKGLHGDLNVREDLGLQKPNPLVDDDMLRNNVYVPLPPYPPLSPQQHSPQSVVDSVSSSNVPELNRASDLLLAVSVGADPNKNKIYELVNSAMDELIRKAQMGPPLWQRFGGNESEILNESEYIREFRAFDASLKEIMRMVETGNLFDFDHELNCDFSFGTTSQNPSYFQREREPDVLQTEASREVGFVGVNPTTVVEWLMDCNQWSSMFSSIVSGAILIGVLQTGSQPGNYNETLQVIRAEYQMLTPLVPARECQFARYCKQLSPKSWGVVDVSLEDVFPYPSIRFIRRPSGCLIEELPNGGGSKVMWVEHVEVDNHSVHPLFRSLVQSSFAFSAKRWVATIIRHCDWVATLMSNSISSVGGELMQRNGKESLLRLAERMMRNFCADSNASGNNSWNPLPVNNADDCMVMRKTVSSFTGDSRETMVFTTSLWIPSSPKFVFEYLRRDESRKKWDILARGNETREISNIIKGENPDNRVSIIQVVDSSLKKVVITHLQESYCDPTGSYLVYAPIDIPSMASLLNGGNPDIVNILPSGFAIHPDKAVTKENEGAVGSVVTIMFHIIDDLARRGYPSDPYKTMYRILNDTAFNIKADVISLEMERGNRSKEIWKYRK